MKTVGIIVEYNPLHNGHLYHIQETRRLSGCDTLICVMSGNFTQRGEPAIIDKFTRTRMAINNGIDLVIELPFVFTVQNADIFAYTSVSILNHLGVDEIYFGSENGDISALRTLGDVLKSETYNNLVKTYSKQGFSYPTASDKAMKDIHPNNSFDLPNNILGIQYLLAGEKLDSSISFKTIKRIGTGYYDEINKDTLIQSATSIRKYAFNKDDYKSYVPLDVYNFLCENTLVNYESFYPQLKYVLTSHSNIELNQIFNISEGFENRLLKVKQFDSVESLIKQVLTKRYTNSKVKRTLAHILCNTKKTLLTSFDVPYIRILGMNDAGKNYLNTIKHELTVPLISKVKEGLHPYLDHEIRVSKIYSEGLHKDIFKEEIGRLIY